MTSTFPGSPKLLKGGLVLVDPASGAIQRVITLQYNPDSMSRTLQVQGVGDRDRRSLRGAAAQGAGGRDHQARGRARRRRPARIPDGNAQTVQFGLHPQIAALEIVINPSSRELLANEHAGAVGHAGDLADGGAADAVRVERAARRRRCASPSSASPRRPSTRRSIPIRAKVSLGLRVLSVDDFGFAQQGRQPVHRLSAAKELLAALNAGRRARAPSASEASHDRSQCGDARIDAADRGCEPQPVRPEQPLLRPRHRHAPAPRRPHHRSTCARRFVPQPERFALPGGHARGRAGRPARQSRREISRRSRAVLAACATPTARCGPTS